MKIKCFNCNLIINENNITKYLLYNYNLYCTKKCLNKIKNKLLK